MNKLELDKEDNKKSTPEEARDCLQREREYVGEKRQCSERGIDQWSETKKSVEVIYLFIYHKFLSFFINNSFPVPGL